MRLTIVVTALTFLGCHGALDVARKPVDAPPIASATPKSVAPAMDTSPVTDPLLRFVFALPLQHKRTLFVGDARDRRVAALRSHSHEVVVTTAQDPTLTQKDRFEKDKFDLVVIGTDDDSIFRGIRGPIVAMSARGRPSQRHAGDTLVLGAGLMDEEQDLVLLRMAESGCAGGPSLTDGFPQWWPWHPRRFDVLSDAGDAGRDVRLLGYLVRIEDGSVALQVPFSGFGEVRFVVTGATRPRLEALIADVTEFPRSGGVGDGGDVGKTLVHAFGGGGCDLCTMQSSPVVVGVRGRARFVTHVLLLDAPQRPVAWFRLPFGGNLFELDVTDIDLVFDPRSWRTLDAGDASVRALTETRTGQIDAAIADLTRERQRLDGQLGAYAHLYPPYETYAAFDARLPSSNRDKAIALADACYRFEAVGQEQPNRIPAGSQDTPPRDIRTAVALCGWAWSVLAPTYKKGDRSVARAVAKLDKLLGAADEAMFCELVNAVPDVYPNSYCNQRGMQRSTGGVVIWTAAH